MYAIVYYFLVRTRTVPDFSYAYVTGYVISCYIPINTGCVIILRCGYVITIIGYIGSAIIPAVIRRSIFLFISQITKKNTVVVLLVILECTCSCTCKLCIVVRYIETEAIYFSVSYRCSTCILPEDPCLFSKSN
jgi:hypothetical protein